jgi:predicted ferric reductase
MLKFLTILLFLSLPAGAIYLYFDPYWDWETLTHSWSIGMIFGLFAFSAVVIQFILGSRLKFLDRLFGQDKILKFHGFLGILIILFIGGHVLFKNLSEFEKNLQVFLGFSASALFNTIIILSALLMSPILFARTAPLKALRHWTAKKLKVRYQHLKKIHNLVSVAGVLAALHMLMASSTSENLVRPVYLGTWFVLSFSVYLYHKVIKTLILRLKPWTVSSIKYESDNILTISLSPGGEFTHKPGQFVYVSFQQPGFPTEEHPFTLSSAPHQQPAFSAKMLGEFTKALKTLQPGAKAFVDGPYGLFTISNEPENRSLVFLAGGIGITPFLSILRSIPKPIECPIHLLWNTKTRSDAYAHAELLSYAQQAPKFHYELLLTQEEAPPIKKMRLSSRTLGELINIAADSAYYICGPDAQMEDLIRCLQKHRVPSRQIHFERFAF